MKLPSYSFLIPAALLLGLAPFAPEPHLVEKLRMLFTGELSKPIDIFDLFLHGTLPALLLVKTAGDALGRSRTAGRGKTESVVTDATMPESTKTRAQRRREERERGKEAGD